MTFDPNTFNPGALEEKVKFMQSSLTEVKAKNEENGKKIDQVLLEVSKMTGGFEFIGGLYKDMALKSEINTGKILVLENDMTSVKDKLKTNASMLWTVACMVIAQIIAAIAYVITQR